MCFVILFVCSLTPLFFFFTPMCWCVLFGYMWLSSWSMFDGSVIPRYVHPVGYSVNFYLCDLLLLTHSGYFTHFTFIPRLYFPRDVFICRVDGAFGCANTDNMCVHYLSDSRMALLCVWLCRLRLALTFSGWATLRVMPDHDRHFCLPYILFFGCATKALSAPERVSFFLGPKIINLTRCAFLRVTLDHFECQAASLGPLSDFLYLPETYSHSVG